jgi:hypothetical protein
MHSQVSRYITLTPAHKRPYQYAASLLPPLMLRDRGHNHSDSEHGGNRVRYNRDRSTRR